MKSIFIIVILGIIIAISSYLRFNNLGRLCFWGAEPIHAMIVKNIRDCYLPVTDTGSLYMRSLPYNYLLALVSAVLSMNEFSLRFPNAFLSLCSIILVYFLGRDMFDTKVGILASLLAGFSIWEIELSRYVRMYIPTQFFTALSIYFFFRGYVKNERRFRVWTYISFFLLISFHQMSIFLTPVVFIPLMMKREKTEKRGLILLLVLLLLFYCMIYFGMEKIFSRFSQSMMPQQGISSSSEDGGPSNVQTVGANKAVVLKFSQMLKSINLPNFALLRFILQKHQVFLATLVLVLMIFSILSFNSLRSAGGPRWSYILTFLLLFFSFMHQFTLAFLILVVLLIKFFHWEDGLDFMGVRYAISGFVFFALFWLIGGLVFRDWSEDLFGDLPLVCKVIIMMFNYPRFQYAFKWLFCCWTQIALVTFTGFACSIIAYYFDREKRNYFYLSMVLVTQIIMLGLVVPLWDHPRYMFYFYLLLLLAYAAFMLRLAEVITSGVLKFLKKEGSKPFYWPVFLAIIIVPIFFFNSEFDLGYAFGISKRFYNTDIEQPHKLPIPSWKRYRDHKSCSQFITENMSPDDIIIAQRGAGVYAWKYYIGKLDYWVRSIVENQPAEENSRGINLVTGTKYITSFEFFLNLIENGKKGSSIWIIAWDTPEERKRRLICDEYIRKNYADKLVYTGLDECTKIYRIEF